MQDKQNGMRILCILLGISIGLIGSQRSGAAAQSNAQLEMEKGKEAVGKACVQCHNMRYIQLQRKSAEQWRNVVLAMISTGALLFPEEIEPVTAYLTANFGPASPPPSLGTPTSGGARSATRALEEQLPEAVGKSIVLDNCQQCHGLETSIEKTRSRTEWKEIISRMVTAGTKLTQAEQEKVVEYLSGLTPSRKTE